MRRCRHGSAHPLPPQIPPSKSPHTGTVITDKAVLSTTHLAAESASAPYLAARSDVVDPAGIAARKTDTPVISGST